MSGFGWPLVIGGAIKAVYDLLAAETGTPIDSDLVVTRLGPPVEQEIAPNHFVSCHRASELSLRGVARTTPPR